MYDILNSLNRKHKLTVFYLIHLSTPYFIRLHKYSTKIKYHRDYFRIIRKWIIIFIACNVINFQLECSQQISNGLNSRSTSNYHIFCPDRSKASDMDSKQFSLFWGFIFISMCIHSASVRAFVSKPHNFWPTVEWHHSYL